MKKPRTDRSNLDRAKLALARIAAIRDSPTSSFTNDVDQRVQSIKAVAFEGCKLDEAVGLLPFNIIADALVGASVPGARHTFTGELGLVVRSSDLRTTLRKHTINALREQTLVATCFDTSSPISAPSVQIPADRWATLTPNWETNSASHAGGVVTGIAVYSGKLDVERKPKAPGRASPMATQAVYREWIFLCEAAGLKPSAQQDLKELQSKLGSSITRDVARQLREKLAPDDWKRPGRR